MFIKRISEYNIMYVTKVIVLALLLSIGTRAYAATLKLDSSVTTLSPGDTATLYVVVNSEGTSINNADASISFPTDLVDVVSINKAGSIFSLWVEEPYFSNTSGVVTFDGGVPTPGFNGSQGPVISILVRAKKVGKADFSFSNAAVRANDGLGTDVLNLRIGKSINIVKKDIPVEVPKVIPIEVVEDVSVQIKSSTHSNQAQWYRDRSPIMQWTPSDGSDAVQISIDDNPSGQPRTMYNSSVKEKEFKDLKDGVWYFKARARKGDKWGPISTYIVRVDDTVPRKNNVLFIYNEDSKKLEVTSDIVDDASGIDYYELYINDALISKIPSSKFVDGKYNIPFSTSGNNTVRMVAIDRAGNSVETSGTFNVLGTLSNKVEPDNSSVNQDRISLTYNGNTYSTPLWFVLILIIPSIISIASVSFGLGQRYSRPRRKSRIQIPTVKKDNIKVLYELKKRLEKHLEILQHTRHNRILSREERDIKEAIEGDLDEVDKEIERQKSE